MGEIREGEEVETDGGGDVLRVREIGGERGGGD